MEIKKLYPGGRSKALTFSYDDGVLQDVPLVEVFAKHGMKCTFNLNTGLWLEPSTRVDRGVSITRIERDRVPAIYAGHELAIHGARHPHLEQLSFDDAALAIETDQHNLTELTGVPTRGLAYPYGTYNNNVLRALLSLGVAYGRTIKSTFSFAPPQAFVVWDPTCHHNSPALFDLGEALRRTDDELALMYVWGHSYEFEQDGNLDRIDRFCGQMSGDDDIWYATNIEICDYIEAIRRTELAGSKLLNHSDMPVFFRVNGRVRQIAPGGSFSVSL